MGGQRWTDKEDSILKGNPPSIAFKLLAGSRTLAAIYKRRKGLSLSTIRRFDRDYASWIEAYAYGSGLTLKQIAKREGVSFQFVYCTLKRLGATKKNLTTFNA